MKFKTKEQLIKEPNEKTILNYGCYPAGVTQAFKSFKERIDFYLKYKMNAGNIVPDFLDKAWNEYKGTNDWNDWLFDCCFGDIK